MKAQESYDRVAEEYAKQISDELQHKPADREFLSEFASLVEGPVADLGCGPGHVTRFLNDEGASAVGYDLSPGMVEQAQRRFPDLRFAVGDMRNPPDGPWGGLLVWYSLIHIPPPEVPEVLAGLHRVLAPDGLILVGFHQGDEMQHRDEWWEHPVDLDFHFFRPEQVERWLEDAGFTVLERRERDPYPDAEAQTRRAAILARR